jgi:hypothetical protein
MSSKDGSALVIQKAFLAGGACAISSFILNPVDVTKTRMMIQSKSAGTAGAKAGGGFINNLFAIYRSEGLRGWGRGLEPSMLREMTYSTTRMGAYEPIRDLMLKLSADVGGSGNGDGNGSGGEAGAAKKDKGDISPGIKFGSSLLSGGVGAAATNPFDLVKTRFQAAYPGQAPLPYTNTWQAFRYITQHEGGVPGLYKAWEATCGRAAFLTSGQLGTYDVVKNNVLIKLFGLREDRDKAVLHLISAMSASVVATTACNPFDVVKSRYMSDIPSSVDGTKKYHSVSHCFRVTLQVDGIRGFFRGWTAAYWRVGPHTVMSLLLFEKLREVFGFDSI